MINVIRRVGLVITVVALYVEGTAFAQDNLQAGMTPAQLYTADCAICHKSPRELTKGRGFYSLDRYLQVHYTASRESAASIASYLLSLAHEPAPQHPHARGERKGKLAPPPKAGADKSSGSKKSAAQTPVTKSSEAKSSDGRATEKKETASKPATPATATAKPSETKTTESKKSATKTNQDKYDKPEKAD